MKIILTQDVDNLGAPGDVVEVKDGYGRNYLVPRGFAIAWTKGGEKQIDQIKRARGAREIRGREHADEVREQLEALTVTVTGQGRRAGPVVRVRHRCRRCGFDQGRWRTADREALDRDGRAHQAAG